jgi:hypothetical protein
MAGRTHWVRNRPKTDRPASEQTETEPAARRLLTIRHKDRWAWSFLDLTRSLRSPSLMLVAKEHRSAVGFGGSHYGLDPFAKRHALSSVGSRIALTDSMLAAICWCLAMTRPGLFLRPIGAVMEGLSLMGRHAPSGARSADVDAVFRNARRRGGQATSRGVVATALARPAAISSRRRGGNQERLRPSAFCAVLTCKPRPRQRCAVIP